MKISRKSRRHYTLPTTAVLSRVIRRVMNSSSNKDISEDDIYKKLSLHTGLSINYFKVRRRHILEISDEIAVELGLQRDSVYNHIDAIESIIHRSIFEWPEALERIRERKVLASFVTGEILKFFDESEGKDLKADIINLDDIYENLITCNETQEIDSELLAFGLLEVWDYLLDQSLIT